MDAWHPQEWAAHILHGSRVFQGERYTCDDPTLLIWHSVPVTIRCLLDQWSTYGRVWHGFYWALVARIRLGVSCQLLENGLLTLTLPYVYVLLPVLTLYLHFTYTYSYLLTLTNTYVYLLTLTYIYSYLLTLTNTYLQLLTLTYTYLYLLTLTYTYLHLLISHLPTARE